MSQLQRRVGLMVVLLHLLATSAFCVYELAVAGPRDPRFLLAAFCNLLLIAVLVVSLRGYHRNWRCFLLFVSAVAIGIGIPEPFVSKEVTFAILVPPSLGLVLGSAWAVVACLGVELLILLARADFAGVYAQPRVLLLLSMIVTSTLLGRRALDLALRASERRAADLQAQAARFRALLEHAADLIAVFDAAGRLQSVSPAVERILGYPAGELVGNRLLELVAPEDVDAVRTWAREAGRRPRAPLRTGPFSVRRRDGSWAKLEATITNLVDEPHVRGLVFNGYDVTQRESAAEAQRDLQLKLFQAQKMETVGRLAGGIAHDFNNLLTIILFGTDRIRRTILPDAAALADLAAVEGASERAATLTRQLLAFARKQVMKPRRLDPNALLADLDKMIRTFVGESVQLEIALDPALWPVRADPGQVEQVILNLAANARDAMPKGGLLTIVTTNVVLDPDEAKSRSLAPGRYVCVAVRDRGVGMTAEVQAHAFEPFFTTKGPTKGTGLGLSTCYGIARQHGGGVTLESRPGAGTTVSVFLPHADDLTDDAAESGPVALLPPTGDGPAGRRATILFVEDEPLVRTVSADTLRAQGFTVLEAADGAEALRVLRTHGEAVDLVITDLVMPRLGGRELAGEVATRHPETKLLFVSSFTEESRAAAQGPRHVPLLGKPFTTTHLLRKVREVLGHRPS
jgi:PAS domain S-box-containing protein